MLHLLLIITVSHHSQVAVPRQFIILHMGVPLTFRLIMEISTGFYHGVGWNLERQKD